MNKRLDQRVAIFIDTQNMYHTAKHLFNDRVNFPAVVEQAVAGRQLIRAVAYVAKSKTGEETNFFDALISHGIELKVKDVQEFSSGAKKADWDVGMTVDAISILPRVDVIVLVTGDGDFIPLVNYIHAHGAICELVSFGSSTSMNLKEIVDTHLNLEDHASDYLMSSLKKSSHNKTLTAKSSKKSRKSSSDESENPPSDRQIRVTY